GAAAAAGGRAGGSRRGGGVGRPARRHRLGGTPTALGPGQPAYLSVVAAPLPGRRGRHPGTDGGPGGDRGLPGGYMLRVGPGVLDWHRFRDLAAAAAGIAGSDPAAAAALLRQALSLWRGPAAADLDGGPPALAARIAAMGEARMITLEQRVEAELAAGRHRELAPQLAELTCAHPPREQFRAHQMPALYRSRRP